LFHAFAVQMNLISPLWFAIRAIARCASRTDGIDHQHLERRRPSGREPTLVSYGAAKSG